LGTQPAMEEQTLARETATPSSQTTQTAHCEVAGCETAATARINARSVCIEHFLADTVCELDARAARLKNQTIDGEELQSWKEFIAECTSQAQRLAQDDHTVDKRTRTRLLDLVLRASHLSQSLRRSPRVQAALPIWLRREDPGRSWEEETWTSTVSEHGAGLVCRHLVEPGGTVVLCRKGPGDRARARVVYCRYDGNGRRQIGVEFIDQNDFWELSQKARAAKPSSTSTSD
jgi:PilZ domain